MKIVPDHDFSMQYLERYTDEKYFRLYHDLKKVEKTDLKGYNIITAKPDDIRTMVSVINQSYCDMQVDYSQMIGYTQTSVYNPTLWILVVEKETGKCVGSGIADYDDETKELILEWIQVLPNYRGKKIGQAIVNELLNRMKNIASFATVSGKIDNPSRPEWLYRKCGFTGNDVWHILRQR